jgi:hypothetical protein
MILIAGFGMLMVFGMPYLLENSESLSPHIIVWHAHTFCGKYGSDQRGVNMADLIFFGDTVDPEMRAEFEERQKSSSANALLPGGQQANPLGNFDAAAWLAGSGKKSEGSAERVVEKGVKR